MSQAFDLMIDKTKKRKVERCKETVAKNLERLCSDCGSIGRWANDVERGLSAWACRGCSYVEVRKIERRRDNSYVHSY